MITPDTGNTIADVKVDGKSVGPVASYNFTYITTSHTIDATFSSSLNFKPSGTPVDNTVYLEKTAVTADTITLAVKIKNGTNVYGAAPEIHYDGSKISYDTSFEGTYFNSGGKNTIFREELYQNQEGILLIGITRTGIETGANGDGTLCTITLKAKVEQTDTPIDFSNTNSLLQSPSGDIPGTIWGLKQF